MARDHGRVKVTIWDDPDFLSLPSSAQHLYLALVTQPKLSYAGLLPLYPRRLAMLASDLTEGKVKRALAELIHSRFVLTDDATGELLVRSYVRHDGLIRQPNVAKAMAKAVIAVESDTLRDAVTRELTRLHQDDPHANGWKAILDGWPDLYAKASGNPSVNPSPNPSDNPSTNPTVDPSSKGSATPLPPSPFPSDVGLGSQSANGRSEPAQSDGLDLARIANILGTDQRWANRVVRQILERAPADVRDKQRYVEAAIRERPADYRPTPQAPRLSELCDHGRERATCPFEEATT